MRGKGSPYEVRCPRCDVSFPVETRRCIHCGGPTAASAATVEPGAFPGPLEAIRTGESTTQPAPIAGGEDSPFSWGRSRDTVATPPPLPPESVARGGELEPPEDGPPSVVGALLRSFGSLFWIIALVAFSMLRNCSEG
jgi:hypothetical protein